MKPPPLYRRFDFGKDARSLLIGHEWRLVHGRNQLQVGIHYTELTVFINEFNSQPGNFTVLVGGEKDAQDEPSVFPPLDLLDNVEQFNPNDPARGVKINYEAFLFNDPGVVYAGVRAHTDVTHTGFKVVNQLHRTILR